MADTLEIRAEVPADAEAIAGVIEVAFRGRPFSLGTEGPIVAQLRAQGDLSVSLVAEKARRIVGQIAFSPAYPFSGGQGWYALGPIAVLPECQREGVGSELIHAGFASLEALRSAGCILVGDARYYSRFGFMPAPSLAPQGEPAEYFMVKLMAGRLPNEPIAFHPAFHSAAQHAIAGGRGPRLPSERAPRPMEPDLATDPILADVLEELIAREPIFHRPEFGTTRRDFESMTDIHFWQVGASGRRYSRQYVIDTLVERHSAPHEDVWEAGGFHCVELAPGTYLLTYTLVQDHTRVTRRATIWRRAYDGWKICYHQGTIVEAS